MKRVFNVQQKLKAPKGQYNSHGGYRFRSCEDILEAVKPLLKEEGLVLLISDDIVVKEGGFQVETEEKRKQREIQQKKRSVFL